MVQIVAVMNYWDRPAVSTAHLGPSVALWLEDSWAEVEEFRSWFVWLLTNKFLFVLHSSEWEELKNVLIGPSLKPQVA